MVVERANRHTVEAIQQKARAARQEILDKYSGGLNLDSDDALWDAMVFTFADFFANMSPGATLADFRRDLMYRFTMPMEDAVSGKNEEIGYKLMRRASDMLTKVQGSSPEKYSDAQYEAYALGVLGKSIQGVSSPEE